MRWSFNFSFNVYQDHRHTEMLTVGFEVDDVERIMDLRLNTDLIPVGFKQRHQHQGGYITETPESVVSTRKQHDNYIKSFGKIISIFFINFHIDDKKLMNNNIEMLFFLSLQILESFILIGNKFASHY